jgi:hypothetical protein
MKVSNRDRRERKQPRDVRLHERRPHHLHDEGKIDAAERPAPPRSPARR